MRKRRAQIKQSQVPWMITFTDVMTLVLSFFVMLVAMSVFDERSKLIILDSVNSVFGTEENRLNPYPTDQLDPRQVPGHAAGHDNAAFNIRRLLLEDNPEVRLSQNALFMVLSINADLLFEPGGAGISPTGRMLLDKFVPYLMESKFPMRVAGHSSPGLDEEGLAYSGAALYGADGSATSGWAISLDRALSVYQHFIQRGVSPESLSMEAYGDTRPSFSNDTQEGRRKNRRVDLILDKRNTMFSGVRDAARLQEEETRQYHFRDFTFDLDYPPSAPQAPETFPPVPGPGSMLPDGVLPGRFGRHGEPPAADAARAERLEPVGQAQIAGAIPAGQPVTARPVPRAGEAS